MNIVLLGAEINNVNLGCQALTYSIISVLEKTLTDKKCIYTILEGNPSDTKIKLLCEELNVDYDRIRSIRRGNVTELLRGIRHAKNNIKCFRAIKEADYVINITQGDGFSDIYGEKRFNIFYGFLLYAVKNNKHIIMAPQTYGPFYSKKVEKKVKYLIDNSSLVIARDRLSEKCVSSITNKNVIVTTDLAFQLPFYCEKKKHEKIRVGINISSLMAEEKRDNFNKHVDLAYKYNQLIDKVIGNMNHEEYEIHLIPHVFDDMVSIKRYKKKYPKTIVHNFFDSPIEAKNLIASMDVFIGSRMHATIASLSSGVPTIPIA